MENCPTDILGMMQKAEAAATPVYQRLANLLEEMIRNRSLRPGDRMPSVRAFSAQQRISVPTALHAYVTLEARGLIEARPKSGFYVRARQADSVPQPKCPSGPPRVAVFDKADPLESMLADHSNPKLVPLGAAMPCPDLLPSAKLARTLGNIARSSPSAHVGYDIAPGSEKLRLELARRSLTWGGALTADDFVITAGATEAVSLALRVVCQPGDTVAVESPCYYGFLQMMRELNLKALPIRTDSARGIDLDVLEGTLKRKKITACLVAPAFQNPQGFVMPDENKQRLTEMMSRRGIPIIEDDINGDLQHEGPRPHALKAYDKDGMVILCSSFSKTLAPGYRIGYIAGGRWHHQIMTLKKHSSLANATLPTLVIADFLKNGGYDRYLRSVHTAYRQQVNRMREAIVEAFPKGIGLSRPRGGFLLWCELPQHVDSVELFRQARASGISIAPGPLFAPAAGGFRNFFRINCGYPWSPQIERAIGVLGHLVTNAGNG